MTAHYSFFCPVCHKPAKIRQTMPDNYAPEYLWRIILCNTCARFYHGTHKITQQKVWASKSPSIFAFYAEAILFTPAEVQADFFVSSDKPSTKTETHHQGAVANTQAAFVRWKEANAKAIEKAGWTHDQLVARFSATYRQYVRMLNEMYDYKLTAQQWRQWKKQQLLQQVTLTRSYERSE